MVEDNKNPTIPVNSVDTSSWGTPSMAPSFVSVEQGNTFTPEPKMPTVTDRSAEIDSFLGAIRYDAISSVNKTKQKSWLSQIDPTGGKISITSEVPLTDTHTKMNDGELCIS